MGWEDWYFIPMASPQETVWTAGVDMFSGNLYIGEHLVDGKTCQVPNGGSKDVTVSSLC